MFKILKWTVIGCLGLCGLNAVSGGRLVEKARAGIERLERENRETITRKISSARTYLRRSEKEVLATYKNLVRSRAELSELDDEISEFGLHQKQLYERASYLDARLATEQASYAEILGTYTRDELEEHRKSAWGELEVGEAVLAQKVELRKAHEAKVRGLEKLYGELRNRQREIKLDLLRLETRLAMLAQDPRWNQVPGASTKALDRADKLRKEIRDEMKVREETLRLQGGALEQSAQLVGPEAEAFRAKVAKKYGADRSSDA